MRDFFFETTRLRDYETARPRDYETTGLRDYETARLQKKCGHRPQYPVVPKSRSPVVPSSRKFSAILSPSQSFSPPPKKKSGTLKRESQNRELVIINCLVYLCGLTSSDHNSRGIINHNGQCYTAIRNNQR